MVSLKAKLLKLLLGFGQSVNVLVSEVVCGKEGDKADTIGTTIVCPEYADTSIISLHDQVSF